MRLALCLILALSATVAQAESLRDALTGKWALLEGSQIATDAENIVAAEGTCAQPEFSTSRGLVLDFRDDRFTADFWASGKMLGAWNFDKNVRGARLDDGRIAMRFSTDGAASHELTFWKAKFGKAENSLMELLGPPVNTGFYLKCP